MTSPFKKIYDFQAIPPETFIKICQHLSEKDLGKLAQASKYCHAISSDKLLWKERYLRSRKIDHWIGPFPNWKMHQKLLYKIDKFNPDGSSKSKAQLYWKMGCLNEAKTDSLSKSRQEEIFWFFAFSANTKLCIEQDKLKPKLKENEKLRVKALCNIAHILEHLYKGNLEGAINLYNENFATFIRAFALVGWTLSEILDFQTKEPLSQKIGCPKEVNDHWYLAKNMLEGGLIHAIERESIGISLPLMRCIFQITYKISSNSEQLKKLGGRKEYTRELHFFYQHLIERISKSKCSSRLYLEYFHLLITHTEQREDFVFALSHLNDVLKQIKDPYMLFQFSIMGLRALGKVTSDILQENQGLLVHLSLLEPLASSWQQNKDKLQLSFAYDLSKLVLRMKLHKHYYFLKSVLRYFQRQGRKLPLIDQVTIEWKLFELAKLENKPYLAITAWLRAEKISQSFKYYHDKPKISYFQELFDYFDETPKAIPVLLKRPVRNPSLHIPRAYAFFKNGEQEKGFSELLKASDYPTTPGQIQWLHRLSQQNPQGMMFYSLFLYSSEDLETFFMEMLDFHPKHRLMIYHNFITRLYFEGHSKEIPQHLSLLIDETKKNQEIQAATFALLGMISKDQKQSRSYYATATKMAPEQFPLNRRFHQTELLYC